MHDRIFPSNLAGHNREVAEHETNRQIHENVLRGKGTLVFTHLRAHMQKVVPISIADTAALLATAGVDRVQFIDLHSGQSQGMFPVRVPTDNLVAGPIMYVAVRLPECYIVVMNCADRKQTYEDMPGFT